MESCEKKLHRSVYIALCGIFSFHYVELTCLIIYNLLKGRKAHIKKKYIKTPLKILAIVSIYGFFSCHMLGYDTNKLIQQSVTFAAFIFLYGLFFSSTTINLQDLFKKYLLMCFIISIFGYIQIFTFFFWDIDIFKNFTWLGETQIITKGIIRPRAFCPESGHLGTILSPALIYIIYFKDKWHVLKEKKYFIILMAILTMSMTAILAICAALYFRFISKSKTIDIIVLLVIALWGVGFFVVSAQHANIQKTSAANIEGIKMRILETGSLLFSLNDIDAIESTNSTTYALMSNFYVAMKAPHRLLGTGLGTHQFNYFRVYQSKEYYAYGLNSSDGYSLLNRLFSEFGIIGLLLYLFVIFRNVNRKDVISFSLLFYIIGSILRGGNYFVSGLIFFHFFFILAKAQYNTKAINC